MTRWIATTTITNLGLIEEQEFIGEDSTIEALKHLGWIKLRK